MNDPGYQVNDLRTCELCLTLKLIRYSLQVQMSCVRHERSSRGWFSISLHRLETLLCLEMGLYGYVAVVFSSSRFGNGVWQIDCLSDSRIECGDARSIDFNA